MARKRSQASVSRFARSISSSGIAWPKEIVAVLTGAPQSVQAGGTESLSNASLIGARS